MKYQLFSIVANLDSQRGMPSHIWHDMRECGSPMENLEEAIAELKKLESYNGNGGYAWSMGQKIVGYVVKVVEHPGSWEGGLPAIRYRPSTV